MKYSFLSLFSMKVLYAYKQYKTFQSIHLFNYCSEHFTKTIVNISNFFYKTTCFLEKIVL